MDDKNIIELFYNRDEAAISHCEIKYGQSLKNLSFNILSNLSDSEECVNDTYIKAWNSIPPQKPCSLFAYLGKIVRNISINLWRKNNAQKRNIGLTIMLSELSDCIPSNETTEEKADARALSEIINSWLNSLSEENRTLFMGRYWLGKDMEFLSNYLNITENSASVKLFRLRKNLKEVLQKEGVAL